MLSTAAYMFDIALTVTLLSSCEAFRWDSAKLLGSPAGKLLQYEGSAQDQILQDSGPFKPGQRLYRTKRHRELVRTQPHLVHNMAVPEIEESSHSNARVNLSQLKLSSTVSQDTVRTHMEDNRKVEDEMERMVHLGGPPDMETYRGQPHTSEADKELLNGQEAGDESQEASGFNGSDMEERERGEEGGESLGRRGRQNKWERVRESGEREREEERNGGAGDVLDASEANLTAPDLDALIGYQRPFFSIDSQQPNFAPPAELHVPALKVYPEESTLERDRWETAVEKDLHSSSHEVSRGSVSTTGSTSDPSSVAGGTGTYDADTGTDFGLLESYTKAVDVEKEAALAENPVLPDVGMAPGREDEEELDQRRHNGKGFGLSDRSEKAEEEKQGRKRIPITTDPSTTISFTDTSWDQLAKAMPWPGERSEVRGAGVTEIILPDGGFEKMDDVQQVTCLAWNDLAERGYVVLDMVHNMNCEEFRVDQGARLLKIMDQVFARRMKSPEGSWILYLSKPTHQQPQLLMNVASDRGVINTNDVLTMLGEIRKILPEVGIQNYSAAISCSFPPSQKRSDYSKLFVVLVVIGSVCTIIITFGFIYICWKRRLPATKTSFHTDELRFVENGCHDNPTLDVASDSQHEMQKKPDSNGLSGEGDVAREDMNRWQVFVNQAATEEQEEEEDTHL